MSKIDPSVEFVDLLAEINFEADAVSSKVRIIYDFIAKITLSKFGNECQSVILTSFSANFEY